MADLSKFTWLVGRSQYGTSSKQYAVWDPEFPCKNLKNQPKVKSSHV